MVRQEIIDFREGKRHAFENEDFSHTSFAKSKFRFHSFINCNFEGSDLSQCNFVDSIIYGSNFSNCDLDRANFRRSKANNCIFDYANVRQTNFESAELRQTSFNGANLVKANFRFSDLRGSSMIAKNIDADFVGAQIDEMAVDERFTGFLSSGWFIWKGMVHSVSKIKDLNENDIKNDIKLFVTKNSSNINIMTSMLARYIDVELESLAASKPNTIEKMLEYEHLRDFLTVLRDGLAAIGASVEHLETTEKTSSIMQNLAAKVEAWVTEEGEAIVDAAYRIPATAGGIALLGFAGAPMPAATAFAMAAIGGQKMDMRFEPWGISPSVFSFSGRCGILLNHVYSQAEGMFEQCSHLI